VPPIASGAQRISFEPVPLHETIPSKKMKIRRLVLPAVAVVLASIPPILVVRDRWLGKRPITPLSSLWSRIPFLRGLALPPYFGVIVVLSAALIALFWLWKDDFRLRTGPPKLAHSREGTVSLRQSRIGLVFSLLSGLILLVALYRMAVRGKLPGWDLAAVIVFELVGKALKEIPAQAILRAWRRKRAVFLTVVLAHVSLVGALARHFTDKRWDPVFLIPFFLSLLNLLRLRRRTRLTVWLVLGAVVLYTLFIDAWWFTFIGDEYMFWDSAKRIAHETLSQIGSQLFSVDGGIGQGYCYLPSLIQAISLKILGGNNFGWRFSSLYVSALAIPFFYRFFRTFAGRRVAVAVSLFLAASHYIMTFGKIGYPILQAYFAMSLGLAAAAWAVRTRRPVAFASLGFAVALCFYVYPAALYVVPLPFLLLLVFVPPVTRQAIEGWATTAKTLLIAIFPLFFQVDFFRLKLPGTIFFRPSIVQSPSNVVSHFASNLIYAGFSYLYLPEDKHFVAVSYVDPLTAVFFAIGLALVLRRVPRNRFALFLIASHVELLFFVGASHDRLYPPATRMHLVLPWFALIAAIGLSWLIEQAREAGFSKNGTMASAVLLLAAVVGLNVYQAYPFSRRHMTTYQDFWALFNRVALRAGQIAPTPPKRFVVVTDGSWREDPSGYHRIQGIYALPPSPEQFVVLHLKDGQVPAEARGMLADKNTLVFFQPETQSAARESVERLLPSFGKIPCPVKTTLGEPRFNLWQSPELPRMCE
jgi:hypothetical protein